jgi:hypothetical protein
MRGTGFRGVPKDAGMQSFAVGLLRMALANDLTAVSQRFFNSDK